MINTDLLQKRGLRPSLRISILFTIVSIGLWLLCVTNLKLQFGYLGLINGLPPLLFVSISLLTIAAILNWKTNEPSNSLAFFQLVILGFILWGTVQSLAGSFNIEFDKIGRIDYILRNGHWDASADVYQNWPGLFILGASLNMVIGSEVISVNTLKYVPLFSQFLLLLVFYMIVRKTTANSGQRWAACWVFLLGLNFIGFVPQMFGAVFLFLCIWLLIVICSETASANQVSYFLILIIFLATLPTVHYLSALTVAAILVILYITRRIRSFALSVIGIIFVLGWSLYVTYPYFQQTLPNFLNHIFRVDVYLQSGLGNKLGVGPHRTVLLLQLAEAFSYLTYAGLGIWFATRKNDRGKFDPTILLIAGGPLIIAAVIGAAYGVELAFRIFLFVLPTLAILVAQLVRAKKMATLVLSVFLLALGPWFFITNFGVGRVGYFPPSFIESLSFFSDEVNTGKALTLGQSWWGTVKNIESVGPAVDLTGRDIGSQLQPLVLPEESDIKNFLLEQGTFEYPRYVPISDNDRALLLWKYGNTSLIDSISTFLDTNLIYNLIYVNQGSSIYANVQVQQ